MTNSEIKQVLIAKGITHLYHVNTVLTACTFIENHGLLSRGLVEDLGLSQTPQETDAQDKQVDVYYDIFFDSVDIHQQIKKINHYGPIVFVYSIDLFDSLPEGKIKITKDNPIRWEIDMSEDKKYFLDIDDLDFWFTKGNFTQHITVRNQTTPLPFDYLEKIVIDNPEIDDTSFFENAYNHLNDLLNKYAIDIPLEVRQCPLDCGCKKQYRTYKQGYTYYKFRFK